MTPRERLRRRLLRLAAETGDPQTLAAAKILEPPPLGILEHVRRRLKPRKDGKLEATRGNPGRATREAVIGPRLHRMALAILAGEAASVQQAAVQEVDRHGAGAHASKEAAIAVLAKTYRQQAESREADAAYLLSLERRSTAAIGSNSAKTASYSKKSIPRS